jgi:hypothetical protein
MSSGLVSRSRPSVEVRSPVVPDEQKEPPPCVGSSSVSSGRWAKACCSVWNVERVRGWVMPGETRSVRAAPPAVIAPPLNNAGGAAPAVRST